VIKINSGDNNANLNMRCGKGYSTNQSLLSRRPEGAGSVPAP